MKLATEITAILFVICTLWEAWSLFKGASHPQERRILASSYFSNIQIGVGQLIFAALALSIFVTIYQALSMRFHPQPISNGALFGFLPLVLFIAIDFIRYWTHRLSHRSRFFWLIHSVHHSDQTFNLSLSIRNPWLKELFLSYFFLPFSLFGVDLGLLLGILAFHHVIQFPVHSSWRGKTPWLDRFLITPSLHRVHHATQPEYIDRNFGEVFSLWDQIFKTFTPETISPSFGLTTPTKATTALNENFGRWTDLYFDLRESKSIRSKIKVLFQAPEKCRKRSPLPRENTSQKNKISQPISSPKANLILLFVGLAFGGIHPRAPLTVTLVIAALILTAIVFYYRYELPLLNKQGAHHES